MRPLLILILTLFFTISLYSQTDNADSLKILNVQVDSVFKVKIIPENALNGNFDLLVTGFSKDFNKNKIEISWSSNYIDGRYVLIITPRQIYLRSNHDNPNPNYLYWLTDISEKQFLLIKDYLDKSESNLIHAYTSKNSNCLTYFFEKAKIEKPRKNKWTNKRYDNFLTVINFINKPLTSSKERILVPNKNDFEEIKILRLVIDIFELQDQIKMIKIK